MIGSLDVENLYGSMDTNIAADIIRNRVVNSNVKFESIDWRWALIYLAHTLQPKDIVDMKLQQVIPKRLGKKVKGVILTVDTDAKIERWRYPTEPDKLDNSQKQRVIATVIGEMVKTVFRSHYYEFDGQIVQKKWDLY